MQKDSSKKMTGYIIINILSILLFIALELIGIFAYTDGSETRLAFRVIGRGVLGVLLVFNSSFMLITRKTTFLNSKVSPKQRLLSSVLLGIVGLGMIITALMGYGINGDPILKWWE